MSIEEIEAEALKLTPQARAKLAGKLLESLEVLAITKKRLFLDPRRGRKAAAVGAARNGADVIVAGHWAA